MTDHHLAQLNVGRLRAPLDSPAIAGFVALLEPVNALADAAPGFVWRLTGEDGDDATGIRLYGDDVMINMSVWESRDALWNFTYRSAHMDALRRRREWFTRMVEPFMAMWWVPAGHVPTLAEARDRLECVRRDGPGPRAFTFREAYDPAGLPLGG